MPPENAPLEFARTRVRGFLQDRRRFITSTDPVAFPTTEDTAANDLLKSARQCLRAYEAWSKGEAGDPPVFFDTACFGCAAFSSFCAAARLANFASPILNFRTFHDHLFSSDRSGFHPTSGPIIAMREQGWWASFHAGLRSVFEYSDLAMDVLDGMTETSRTQPRNYLDFHDQTRLRDTIERLIRQVERLE